MSDKPFQFPPSMKVEIEITYEDYQKLLYFSHKRFITEKSLLEKIVHDKIFEQYLLEVSHH